MNRVCASSMVASIIASVLVSVPFATAGVTTWTINPGLSSVTLSIPQQTVTVDILGSPTDVELRARNQTGNSSWTVGNTSSLSGTIRTNTNFNTMVDVIGGTHNIDGLTSGNWDPLAGGVQGTAPADYGVKIQGNAGIFTGFSFQDAAFGAVRDVLYDVDSAVLPVAGGNFTAAALTVGVLSGTVDYRGVGVFESFIMSGAEPIPPTTETNGAGTATISPVTIASTTATLTIPINVAVMIQVSTETLMASLTGTVVATATLPKAGDANMDGLVDIFDVNMVSANWNGPPPEGDVNYDGAIDIFDINAISANWMPGGSATAVPEPSALILAACGLTSLACMVRRRCKANCR